MTAAEYIASFIAEAIETFSNKDLDPLSMNNALDRWALKELSIVTKHITAYCTTRVHEDSGFGLQLSTWSGPQGTGKGTNMDALSHGISILAAAYNATQSHIPESIAPLVQSYSGKASTVAVGTGGIFNPSGNQEYQELFGDLQILTKSIVQAGYLVADSLVTLCVLSMIWVRIEQGSTRIQLDVWPRSTAQFEQYDAFVSELRIAGIVVSSEIIGLRLLDQQDITAQKENNREIADVSEEMATYMKDMLDNPKTKEQIVNLPYSLERDILRRNYDQAKNIITGILETTRGHYLAQKEIFAIQLLDEMERSLERMEHRFMSAYNGGGLPRKDEMPQTQLNRLIVQHLQSTLPAFLRAFDTHEIIFMSSIGSPSAVVQRVLQELVYRIEGGAFVKEYPKLWAVLQKVVGGIAEDIVARREIDISGYQRECESILTQ